MAIILKKNNSKFINPYPQSGSYIDFGNPITANLSFFTAFNNDGIPNEMINGLRARVVGSKYSIHSTIKGKSLSCDGNGSIYYPRGVWVEKKTADITFACYARRTGTVGAYARTFSKTYNNGSSPFYSYTIAYNNAGAGQNDVAVYTNNSASVSGTIPDSTVPHLITGTSTFNLAQTALYINKSKIGTFNGVGQITYDQTTSGDLIIGGDSNASVTNAWIGDIYWVAVWMRVLSHAEISRLYDDPFQFIRTTKKVFLIKSTSSGINATANPSLVIASILVNTSTESFNTSSTAVPNLSSITIQVQTAVATASVMSIATPSLATVSVLVQTSTESFNTSSTAIPSLQTVTFLVNSSTASSTSSQSSNATPSLVGVTVLLNSATASSTTSQSSTATPSLQTITIQVNSSTTSFTKSVEALPGLNIISFTIPQATQSKIENRIAQPSLSTITIIVNTPSGGQVTESGIKIKIISKSAIDKQINNKSRISTYILEKSKID